MSEIHLKDETFQIQGACFEVYNEKGCGFLESVYRECLEIEFRSHDIPFVSQPKLELEYKGQKLKSVYQPNFICYDEIIVEIKAVKGLTEGDRTQTQNFIKSTGHRLAILVNFGHFPKAQIERII